MRQSSTGVQLFGGGLARQRAALEARAVPAVAREYYNSVGYYLSMGGKVAGFERTAPLIGEEPVPGYGSSLSSLKDVFNAIRKDESDHVIAMRASRGELEL